MECKSIDNNKIIKHHIHMKINPEPYRVDTNKLTTTDMNIFPYTRFFRGKYYLDKPQVFNREAGITLQYHHQNL
jgi:hypothetical protein